MNEKELLKAHFSDIAQSIIGVIVLWLIWRYWSHTVAALIFVYTVWRNHGHTRIMIKHLSRRLNERRPPGLED